MPTATKPRKSGKNKKSTKYTAATADRHELYQLSVQNVEAEIDFVDDLIGQSFQIRNPNAVANCGCGTSFSI